MSKALRVSTPLHLFRLSYLPEQLITVADIHVFSPPLQSFAILNSNYRFLITPQRSSLILAAVYSYHCRRTAAYCCGLLTIRYFVLKIFKRYSPPYQKNNTNTSILYII